MSTERRHFIMWDLETSGLDPELKQEIVQIAAKAINYHDYADHKAGEFHIVLQPQYPEAASKEAIAVIGEEMWASAQKNGVHPKVGLRKFLEFIDSVNPTGKYYTAPVLVGYNSLRFDEMHLRFWLRKYRLVKRTGSKPIEWPWAYYGKDVLLQMTDLFTKDDLTNRKLDTFLDMFNMSREKGTHDAMEDVRLQSQLFIRYMKMMERVRSRLIIKPSKELVTNP